MTNPERIPFLRFVSALIYGANITGGYVYLFITLSGIKSVDTKIPIELEIQRVLAGIIVNVIGITGLVGIVMENIKIILLSDVTATTYIVFAILRLSVILITDDYRQKFPSIYKTDLIFIIWTIVGSSILQFLSWPIIYHTKAKMRYHSKYKPTSAESSS